MKNAFKLKSLALSVAVASSSMAVMAPNVAQAELTGNIGLMSEYYFRGIQQSDGVSPEFGIDYEHESGFYIGAWSAKVDEQDIEYDIYGGYETEISGFTLGAGFTLYRYLERDWDTAYDELNLWAGYGPFTLMVDRGLHRDQEDADGKKGDRDYTVVSVAAEYAGFYGVYGRGMGFLPDEDNAQKGEDHTWVQLGYSTEIYTDTTIDFSILRSSKEATGDKERTTLLLGINKSFSFM
ncbi:hypothetical protein THIAE_02905 [Thiomicrospira aerophila AL3]|uniref:Outer membrane protein beta-barrel domain-containing protein n=1 Tax=Thiomicrospira aerophila AL3 TaxID=717772 RepID=W0DVG5_9GAMM|nr:TorF family putative porin [Thiomicrospira aerophila]AHF00861.1 hypothetical protein THIAE_02905 [Thiomicrospira aerophila AL3]